MEIVISPSAKRDIEFWKKSGNTGVQNKITELLNSLKENPFTGIGKPDPLKHNYSGLWSRRINREHQLIYEVTKDSVIILSLKGHYV